MKHLRFTFAEPIVGIQRVRNEVFTSDERTIVCYDYNMMHRICGVLRDLQVNCTMNSNSEIILGDDYHISLDASNLDEFYVVKGYDDMRVLDSIDVFREECI